MEIKRNFYSTFIDTIIYIFMTLMMMTVLGFFMNINNDEVSVMSIFLPFILSVILSGIIMTKYYDRFPVSLALKDEQITFHKLLREDKVHISDIIKISEINTMSKVTGSILYVIKYEGNSVSLNNKRYNKLDKFISKIKEKSPAN